MKLWKRAVGAVKDKNSIVVVYVSRRNSFRNPELEAAIIKATSHDELLIDKRSAQVVFSWIRASPVSLGPLIWALSRRMEKTRSWVVAIKGLMLMHGIFHCKAPVVQMMQRLPFDLSTFSDGHSKPSKTWGFNSIIREYFAFLDQRAAIFLEQDNQNNNNKVEERSLLVQQLLKLEKWQSLLDLLLHIRPRAENMKVRLIMEAMDCVIIEIYDVYSIICNEIAKISLKIYSVTKHEAAMALRVLQKAMKQSEELSLFFEFCKEYGVLNSTELPTVTRIPEEDVEELERIMNGVSVPEKTINYKEGFEEMNQMEMTAVVEEDTRGTLRTIITDKWVVFDENDEKQYGFSNETKIVAEDDAGKDHLLLPLVPINNVPVYNPYELPDLISF
ncbi:putative clathrin assembly protein At1g25240 [Gossypium arboreum]|uniref:ENTH domain-containing protein n=1 Tax=Gossypium arboreum TaxID=29729 RepID=A0ABR0QIU6_GOSAR|nr:putative clathrin assembly protein At1g25240 [Gossypium arboreum]KAK5839173.1 hypothetical protein PVK06_007942 [Gossypium arboreum]